MYGVNFLPYNVRTGQLLMWLGGVSMDASVAFEESADAPEFAVTGGILGTYEAVPEISRYSAIISHRTLCVRYQGDIDDGYVARRARRNGP